MKKYDLVGQKFGKLNVKNSFVRNGRGYWDCICDCGNKKIARTDYLVNGKTHSCGCDDKRQKVKKDLIGVRFGRLIVIGRDKDKKRTHYFCRCECGVEKSIRSDSLTNGKTVSCGCYNRDEAIKNLVEGRIVRRLGGVDVQQLKQKLSRRNKSGTTGVCFIESEQKWRATLGIKNMKFSIRAKTKEEAIQIRTEFEEKYHKPYLENKRSGE